MLDFSLGYQIVFFGRLEDWDNRNQHLSSQSQKKVHADWTGLRLKLGIAYNYSIKY